MLSNLQRVEVGPSSVSVNIKSCCWADCFNRIILSLTHGTALTADTSTKITSASVKYRERKPFANHSNWTRSSTPRFTERPSLWTADRSVKYWATEITMHLYALWKTHPGILRLRKPTITLLTRCPLQILSITVDWKLQPARVTLTFDLSAGNWMPVSLHARGRMLPPNLQFLWPPDLDLSARMGQTTKGRTALLMQPNRRRSTKYR